jgi:hypothetical protein
VRIQIAVPEAHVTKSVLDGALEAVTRLDEQLIKAGATPTDQQLIARGAKWKPEPPGEEHFDHGGVIAARGHGDCDDWAPLRAARLRVTGEDPGARAVVRKSGPKRWHATVIRSDGSEDDPSLDAGMPGPAKTVGARGPWVPVMRERLHGVDGTYIATPHLALRPIVDRHGQVESWQARADLPWHWQPGDSPADLAMTTLHRSPVSDQAVVGAVRGAFRLGLASGYADPEHLKRMSAIAEACEGASWEDIADAYGPEHADAAGAIVGGFFGKAFKKLGKIAKGGLKFVTKNPLGKLAMGLVPGASLATTAFNMASPGMKKSVQQQRHVPQQQRAPVLVSPRSSHVPTGAAPAQTSNRPVIVEPRDPNVTLLTNFADRLQRAYEFSGPRAAQPSPQPRRAVRPIQRAPARRPGTAWPR